MTGIIASPPQPASPPASVVAADGGFWPGVDVNGLRAALRLGDGVVTHERLVGAIEGALAGLMLELRPWRALQIAAGAATLDAVEPEAQLNGDPMAVALWARAVRFRTAAEISDAYADLTATDEGGQRGAERRVVADDYRRMATAAERHLTRLGAQDAASSAAAGGCLVDLI